MPNTFITPDWVSTDVAMNWMNNIKFVAMMDRTWEGLWKDLPDGAQIGFTAQVRIPQRFRVKRGQALQQQPILNQTVPVALTDQLQVAMGWSSADTAVVVEEVQSRYTKPAGQALSNECDRFSVDQVFRSVYYYIGTPGVPITDNEIWTDGVARLRNVATPDDLYATVDPLQQSKLQANNLALFNPQQKVGRIFDKGFFGFSALGVDEWAWDPNMPTFTTGSFDAGSSPAVQGGSQSGSTLTFDGINGNYSFPIGQIFVLDGVYTVNPLSYTDTAQLQSFTLTAAVAGATSGTLTFSPPLIADTASQLQTVTNLPADNAAITFVGATGSVNASMTATRSRQGLICNPAAFAFVTADLPKNLAGAVAGRISDAEAKVSIRYVDQYQISTDQLPRRMDMLVGAAPILPWFALRAFS